MNNQKIQCSSELQNYHSYIGPRPSSLYATGGVFRLSVERTLNRWLVDHSSSKREIAAAWVITTYDLLRSPVFLWHSKHQL